LDLLPKPKSLAAELSQTTENRKGCRIVKIKSNANKELCTDTDTNVSRLGLGKWTKRQNEMNKNKNFKKKYTNSTTIVYHKTTKNDTIKADVNCLLIVVVESSSRLRKWLRQHYHYSFVAPSTAFGAGDLI